jgi:hypothetical protein
MKFITLWATIAMMSVASSTSPAFAANWKYAATNSSGTVFYFDSASLRRTGNTVTVWEKHDASQDKTERIREAKILMRYDCKSRTETVVALFNYYKDGSVQSFDIKRTDQETGSIPPDTNSEKRMKAVCRI